MISQRNSHSMEPTVPSLHHDGDKEPKKVFPGGPDHLVNNKLMNTKLVNNKLIIFTGALSALYLMTVLSALLGWVVTTFIPREITYYTCTAIMFLFGLKMLWEAWRMKDDEAQETQREVEEELGVASGNNPGDAGENFTERLWII